MSSQLCLKFHLGREVLRVRVNLSECQTASQLSEYIEKVWPKKLEGVMYRLFYTDESGEMCVLNDLSIGDALGTAEERAKKCDATPVLDVYVKVDGDGDDDDSTPVAAQTATDLLNELNLMTDPFYSQQLVDSLVETGQDMDKFVDTLQSKKDDQPHQKADKKPSLVQRIASRFNSPKKNTDGGSSKPQMQVSYDQSVQNGSGSPKVSHFEKKVSSEKEAKEAMAEFLKKSGYVSNQKTAEDLVNRLFGPRSDFSGFEKFANSLLDYGDAGNDEKKAAKKSSDLRALDTDESAKEFADMLNDFDFVDNSTAARELTSALMSAQQDLEQIENNFAVETAAEKAEQKKN
ncbi:hypothetical protein FOZ62_028514 [Perkinsus olseni]|uniref:Uncharacterized protein n=1 Tax=Perkinsus olseni TaxID=32597 RepID=A0A7J6UCQ9_PEROL|nr:hypothetical protein FOZ62_028514 [Perkinsus olseni]